MIKTAIENKQNLIIEGCYIPFDWQHDFTADYLSEIKYICLVMSKKYITEHFDGIKCYANVIEQRLDDRYTMEHQQLYEGVVLSYAQYLSQYIESNVLLYPFFHRTSFHFLQILLHHTDYQHT